VLALRACAEEDKDGWACLLQDLRSRGATQIDLIVTDGHDGLLAAVAELFSATPRQRCLVHKQRNVLNAVPRRVRHEVETELAGIWAQPNKEGALTQLDANTRQIWQALSRGGAQSGRGRRQDAHLLRVSADDASLHQNDQRHRESVEPRPSTDRPDRRVHDGDELPDHRLGHHRGDYPQKSPGGIDQVATKEGAAHNTT
jgi:Transposase, Mutator family